MISVAAMPEVVGGSFSSGEKDSGAGAESESIRENDRHSSKSGIAGEPDDLQV
jgi:hypothetical protein